jgi:DNA-directed RNA polymerase subunit P
MNLEMSDGNKGEADSKTAFGSVVYECEHCGTKQTLEQLLDQPELRCINCGYRVLKKVRPPVVKKVDAV